MMMMDRLIDYCSTVKLEETQLEEATLDRKRWRRLVNR